VSSSDRFRTDREAISPACALLEEKGIPYNLGFSRLTGTFRTHRLPREHESEYSLIIAAAGLAAALPGVVAALVKLPVIGVPLVSGPLSGMDALLSILQLPKGVPVATMGIGKQGVVNAVLLAERILGPLAP
jgi:phosphoribosylaminoimidazole carboxylase PurE protein